MLFYLRAVVIQENYSNWYAAVGIFDRVNRKVSSGEGLREGCLTIYFFERAEKWRKCGINAERCMNMTTQYTLF